MGRTQGERWAKERVGDQRAVGEGLPERLERELVVLSICGKTRRKAQTSAGEHRPQSFVATNDGKACGTSSLLLRRGDLRRQCQASAWQAATYDAEQACFSSPDIGSLSR